jgi:hypothetical protein
VDGVAKRELIPEYVYDKECSVSRQALVDQTVKFRGYNNSLALIGI